MIKEIFWRLASTQSPINGAGLPGSPNKDGSVNNNATSGELQTLLGVFFGIVGAMAVLVLVLASVNYITSAGDPQKASRAKNSIIFALVGLSVAIAAEGIVTFVVNRL